MYIYTYTQNPSLSHHSLGQPTDISYLDQIDAMMSHSGLSRDELLSGLSQYLPQAVDSLTPSGRVPTEHEIVRSL